LAGTSGTTTITCDQIRNDAIGTRSFTTSPPAFGYMVGRNTSGVPVSSKV
jgi:hypothetical protein